MEFNDLINIKLTQESGQTSQASWKFDENTSSYNNVILIDNIPVLLKVSQDNINSFSLDYEIPGVIDDSMLNKYFESKITSEVRRIFDLDYDINKFYKYLENDEKLAPSVDFCKGLRLFEAVDPFEAIIASISSSNNSIARWTNTIKDIKRIWGDEFRFPSGTYYKFPPSEVLMSAYETKEEESEADDEQRKLESYTNNLKSCGLGYRVKYVKEASELFSLEADFNEFFKMSYDEAFDEIIKIKGVGPKVADCILLYGFNFKEAFPTDVWIKRIMSYLYFNNEDVSVKRIREFGMDKFGDYAGYVQLYLFHYARKSGLMYKLKK
ncbi:3-methyladenine DNA glycosylase [Methanobrevibacter sp. 87.7]|uniref:DNA glycosylase n=1 Tax=Methanobrevibacter sp. 87.7 TaxID=387957 RepID=UPI000B512517|nr:DNA glycosylase [Methanobrevibacter sp. 87.7]OWT33260.1 3-methyladenine DNA glycosylase [Methanobrevibacter sp. 87.7]